MLALGRMKESAKHDNDEVGSSNLISFSHNPSCPLLATGIKPLVNFFETHRMSHPSPKTHFLEEVFLWMILAATSTEGMDNWNGFTNFPSLHR